MSSSGRGTGVVGYNVQVTVDPDHYLIVTYEVTNVGTDRAQLSGMAIKAKALLDTDRLAVVADRGYFSGEQILASERAGVTVTLPKPMTSEPTPPGGSANRTSSLHVLAYNLTRVLNT